MKKEPVLVIMAAGMGSRFGGLKQIEPVSDKGELIIDFSLYDAVMAGFKKAVFVIKRENEEDFRRLLDGKAGKYIDIEYAYQELGDIPEGYEVPEGRQKPWGTAHAVMAARKKVDGPFAVINSDDYYGPGAFQSIFDFLENAEDGEKYNYCMVGYDIENTLTENGFVSRGVCEITEEGLLSSITERTKIQWHGEKIVFTEDAGTTGAAGTAGAAGTTGKPHFTELSRGTVVSMNFWGFTASILAEMEAGFAAFFDKALAENPMKGEYFLPGVVDRLISDGKAQVKVLRSRDRWYGVTYKEDKQSVVDALRSMKDKGEYPDVLWK